MPKPRPKSVSNSLAQADRRLAALTATYTLRAPPAAAPLPEGTVLPPIWSPPAGVPSVRALYIPVVGPVVEVRVPKEDGHIAIANYVGGGWDFLGIGRGYVVNVNDSGRLERLPENRNFMALKPFIHASAVPIVGPALLTRLDEEGEGVDVEPSVTVDNWQTLWAVAVADPGAATTQVSVVVIPVDSAYGDPVRVVVSMMEQVKCLLCSRSARAADFHTARCSECPASAGIYPIRPIAESLADGRSTTCILRHPTLRYPALKDNVHFAGLIPHESIDGTIVIVQLQKVNGRFQLRQLPTYIGTCNPALDVFRPMTRASGFGAYWKRDANGTRLRAVPYNPAVPFSYEDEDHERARYWTFDGVELPTGDASDDD